MKVLILGIDGYIGWSLALHLKKKGHEVFGIDDLSRRENVEIIGSDSLTPIIYQSDRRSIISYTISNIGDMTTYDSRGMLYMFKPDVIFHLAEQPSAPFSMRNSSHAIYTQSRNVLGTLSLLWAMKEVCPSAHLIKLGTMGEYGVPNCDIPEGRIPEDQCQRYEGDALCPMVGLMFPRTAGSFYHLSKVMDTLNIEFCCRNWGLTSTDIMQGVVFGLNDYENESEITRFDYDEYFGTVINRFCAQAIIEHPLTIYGSGGQTRGFLPLKDSIQCLEIAMNNPPEPGEYRTLNQFESIYSVNQLAMMVCEGAMQRGIVINIEAIPNPRKEAESHYYNPAHQKLFDLGYQPTTDIQGEITKLISQLMPYKSRIRKEVIMPKTNWR